MGPGEGFLLVVFVPDLEFQVLLHLLRVNAGHRPTYLPDEGVPFLPVPGRSGWPVWPRLLRIAGQVPDIVKSDNKVCVSILDIRLKPTFHQVQAIVYFSILIHIGHIIGLQLKSAMIPVLVIST